MPVQVCLCLLGPMFRNCCSRGDSCLTSSSSRNPVLECDGLVRRACARLVEISRFRPLHRAVLVFSLGFPVAIPTQSNIDFHIALSSILNRRSSRQVKSAVLARIGRSLSFAASSSATQDRFFPFTQYLRDLATNFDRSRLQGTAT